MKVLITGATGFAGGHLIELLLKEKADICGTYLIDSSLNDYEFLSDKVKFCKLDLLDKPAVKQLLDETKPDEIYHLAALTSPAISFSNPQETITNNIVAQINLLEAVHSLRLDSRILIIGSADEYGIVDPKNIPITEKTPFNPTSPYSISKITQDLLGLQYFNSYRMKIYRARPFNHIGPRQSDAFVVASFCKQIANIEKGKQEKIIKVGETKTIRDFTDVRDMVLAYKLLMRKGIAGQVYNIGSQKGYRIKEILEILLSLTPVKIKVETDSSLLRPVENPVIIADSSLFNKTTGWKPTIPIKKTLLDTLEYWRKKVITSS